MQLLGVAYVGPRLVAHFGNSLRIEPADFSQYRLRQDAAHLDRTGAALFERRIVEIGIGIGIKNFVGKLRWNRRVYREGGDAAIGDVANHPLEPFDVEGFGKNVLHHFADKWMLRNRNVAFRKVFLASEGLGKNGGQQVVGAHALDRRRNFFAIAKTKQRQRAAGVPAPARSEKRRSQHGLLQNGAKGIGMEKVKHIGERKTVLLAEGDIQSIIGGRGL